MAYRACGITSVGTVERGARGRRFGGSWVDRGDINGEPFLQGLGGEMDECAGILRSERR